MKISFEHVVIVILLLVIAWELSIVLAEPKLPAAASQPCVAVGWWKWAAKPCFAWDVVKPQRQNFHRP